MATKREARKLEKAMTPAEVQQTLDELIEQGLIVRRWSDVEDKFLYFLAKEN
jgi:hypothetical protein